MAYKSVLQFLEASSTDETLKNELADLMGVGDGDISDPQHLDQAESQAIKGQKGVLVTDLAQKRGYDFTLAELTAVVSVFQQYLEGSISAEVFEETTGISPSKGETPESEGSMGNTVQMVYLGVKYTVDAPKHEPLAVLAFMKKTHEDAALKEGLQKILAVGDGDISDVSELDEEEARSLTSERGALVTEFANQNGFAFTLAELLAVTNAFQRVQAGELTEADFDHFLEADAQSKGYFPYIENVASMTFKGVKYAAPVTAKINDNTLSVVRFLERTGSDDALSAKMKEIVGGDGNISGPAELDADEAAALSGERSQQIIELGAEYGYRFSAQDLSTVIGAFQLVNAGELSPESCSRILSLGKSAGQVEKAKKTAGLVYRGVAY
ncbi:hypothetical protein FV139_17415 [Parahaliea maris]|uniref:Uncharacterized protein n=1 Tax=Parahaliea maris TaxID=2716870 RepID=A0A5C8ZQN4_9GAMM|nr:hypothetical protein [Parahaliea maris]TXS90758.1 hypothetical protein FV139_17415 [Parahaliea maris]